MKWGQIKNNNLTQHGCKVELRTSSGHLIQQQQPCFWLFKVCNSSMQIRSQTGLQPDVPCRRPPSSHMPQPHAPQLHSHIAAPITPLWLHRHPPPATRAMALHTSQLHGHIAPLPPSSHARCITACPAAWPRCCLPRSHICHCPSATHMGHVAACPTAGRTTLLPPSQPHTPHRCTGHVAPLAATQHRHMPHS
jgi:hypothetical protein